MKTSASQQCKQSGLSSLAEVSRMTGQSVQTLHNWHKNKAALFNVIVVGCVAIKAKYEKNN